MGKFIEVRPVLTISGLVFFDMGHSKVITFTGHVVTDLKEVDTEVITQTY